MGMELQPWAGWSVAFDFVDEGYSDRSRALLVTNRLEPGLYLEERLSHDPLLDNGADFPLVHDLPYTLPSCDVDFGVADQILHRFDFGGFGDVAEVVLGLGSLDGGAASGSVKLGNCGRCRTLMQFLEELEPALPPLKWGFFRFHCASHSWSRRCRPRI